MNLITTCLLVCSLAGLPEICHGQPTDSTQTKTTGSVATFSGSAGLTNNGFSIVPTFSLNRPAAIMNFYWRKKRFSFDPDIRLVSDASKGGFIFWFRYRLIEQKKFSLRVGVHPAFSLVKRMITDNGNNSEITEMLRFAAAEIVPAYQITPHWGISAVYLHGSGLQRHGPQNTNVLFLNNTIANIGLGGDFRFTITPTFYLLYLDGHQGSYFSGTAILSKKNIPFTIQSTINQTLKSDIPNNKKFMWNIMVAYNFSKRLKLEK